MERLLKVLQGDGQDLAVKAVRLTVSTWDEHVNALFTSPSLRQWEMDLIADLLVLARSFLIEEPKGLDQRLADATAELALVTIQRESGAA